MNTASIENVIEEVSSSFAEIGSTVGTTVLPDTKLFDVPIPHYKFSSTLLGSTEPIHLNLFEVSFSGNPAGPWKSKKYLEMISEAVQSVEFDQDKRTIQVQFTDNTVPNIYWNFITNRMWQEPLSELIDDTPWLFRRWRRPRITVVENCVTRNGPHFSNIRVAQFDRTGAIFSILKFNDVTIIDVSNSMPDDTDTLNKSYRLDYTHGNKIGYCTVNFKYDNLQIEILPQEAMSYEQRVYMDSRTLKEE